MKKFIFLIVLLFSLTLFGQEFKQSSPLSKSISLPTLQNVNTVDVSTINWVQIHNEDAIARANKLPIRAGISIANEIDPSIDGQWTLLPNNKVVWRYKLAVPGATSIALAFDQWKLSEDAELFIYNDNGYIVGAYTFTHNDQNGGIRQMSTVPVPGEVITIELIENANPNTLATPPQTKGQTQGDITIQQFTGQVGPVVLTNYTPKSILHISEVVLIYNDQINDLPNKDLGDAASCQVNINCSPEGDNWQVQKRGVARILFKDGASWYYCSGTLINNTQNNGTPYFLTAYHCGATASAADHNQWQFYFNYERPGCPNTGTPPNNLITGCVLRAGGDISGGTDFQLVELNTTPSLSWNPYYNGWSRSTTASPSGVGIHHPSGDAKKISTYTTALGTGTWPGGYASGHWTVKWAATSNGWGCTEGGSSGSPLFDNNKRVVGTLTGGNSTCTTQSTATDYYGKFNLHWTANGTTSDKQLKPWLDPLNTNPTTLDGFDPNANINPPVADFSATPTTITAGQSVQFSDISTNYPTSWKWTFQGGIPSTSTFRSPTVTYSTPGTYPVKLVVSNQYGSDSIIKTNYITVTAYTAPTSPVTIGTGTTTGGVYPLGINGSVAGQAKYVCDASIYLSSEIGGSGIIKQIAWRPGTARTDTRNIKIYFKYTSATSFTAGTFSDLIADATLVYDGTFTPNVADWFPITLQTPFNYVQGQNLMVLTYVYITGTTNAPSDCYYTSAANRHQQWKGNADPSGNNGTVNSNRPNIQLTIDPYTVPVANFVGLDDIFSEDFEGSTFPPANWTVVDGDTDPSGSWRSSTVVNHTPNGLKSAYHGWGNGTTYQKGWLITPAIVLPSGSPKLSFWSYNTYPTYYVYNGVMISTTSTDTTTFTQIWSPTSVSQAWTQNIIDLSAYAGQTVYIAFRYRGTDGDGWYVDDVKVQKEESTQVVTYEGDPVSIIDKSTNLPTIWEWTLPGANDNPLYTQNVNTIYNVAGQYDVSLKVANPAGESSISKTNFVKVLGRTPIARLEGIGNLKDIYLRPFIPKGGTVNYIDKSQRVPTGWNWYFDGGVPSSSTLKNPSNIKYLSPGEYNVTLNAYNAYGADTITYLDYVVVGGIDTCTNLLATDGITVYNANSGFLPGHCNFVSGFNNYKFYKYAEYYKNSYPGKIYGFGMFIYKAQGSGKTINVTVWSDNDGVPGTVLYTETRDITSFTENAYNIITFTTPVNVSGNFFIGYELNYDGSHNYTTHQFCGTMASFRSTLDNATAYGSFGTASPGTWYAFQDVFGDPSSLWLDLIFEYNDPGLLAAVEAIPGCGTGSVKVVSSSYANQTFYLTNNIGTTLQQWTGTDSIHIFTGLNNGIYRGKVQIGAQTSALSDSVNLVNASASEAGTLTAPLAEICLGSSTGVLTLTGYSGNIIKWQKKLNSGIWIDIANISNTYSEIPSSSGTWHYRVFVQNATCSPDSSNIVSITVIPETEPGTLSGGTSEVCVNSNSGVMTLTGYTGNILRWERRINGGVWENITNTTNTHNENLTSDGTYEFRVLVQNGVCESKYSNILTITVDPLTVPGTLTAANTEVCVNNNSGVMTLTGYIGNILHWERRINGGVWENIANTTNTYSENLTTVGTYEFRVLVQSGECASAYSNILTITVDPLTVPGTLTAANTEVCVNSNSGVMTLTGYTGNILRWEHRINGGAWQNIANTTNIHDENLTTEGTYEFRVLVQNGVCASAYSNIITIIVDPLTVPGTLTASNTEVCVNSNSGIMSLTGYNGNIVRWERRINGGVWENIANTANTYNENLTTVGTYEFRVLVQNGVCESKYSNILTITVDPFTVPGTLTASNTEVCVNSNSGVMTLTGYTGNIIRWERRINGGSWQNIANITNTFSENLTTEGTYEFRVLVQSGVCASAYSNIITINVDPLTVPGTLTAANTEVCVNNNSGVISLTGYTGNILHWERRINGGSWENIANTTNTYNENLTTVGTYEFRVLVQNGVCASEYSNIITITVDPLTVPGTLTAANTEVCVNSNSGVMTLAGYTGNIVRWERRINGGSWQNIANTTNTHNENLTTEGTYEFRVLLKSGVCASEYSNIITITVDPATAPGTLTSSNSEVCINSNSGLMTLIGYTGNILHWERRVNGGAWENIANTTNTYNENLTTAGFYEFRVLVKSGVCESLYSNIISVNVYNNSVAGILSTVKDTIYLGESTGTISLVGYIGNIIKWQKSIDNILWTDIANTSNIYQEIPNQIGSWSYRAVVKNGVCDYDTSNIVNIFVKPSSAGTVTGGISTICFGESTGTMIFTDYTGTIVRWEKRVDNGVWIHINNTNDTYSEIPISPGQWEYRAVSFLLDTLYSASNIITVYPLTVPGTLTAANTEVCVNSNSGVMSLTGYTGNILRWERRINGGVWENIANTTNTHNENLTTVGTYEFRVLVQSGVCASAYSNIITINVDPPTLAGTLTGGNSIVCINNNSGVMTLTGYTGNILRWERRINGGSWQNIANTTNTYNENLTTEGTYEFRVLVQSGVCASAYSNIITITVDPLTVPGTLTAANTEVCVNNNSGVMTLAGYTGNIVRWEKRINGGVWQNISNTTNTYNEILTTVGTYEFRVLVQNGVCASAYSNIITITVDPLTVPGTLTAANTEVCVNSNSGIMTLAGYTGNIVRWERRINGGSWQNISNTTNTHNENLTTEGTYEFRVLVQSGVCASVYSNIITITVDPLTVPGTLTSSNSQVCVNSNSGVMTLSGKVGNILRWEKRINGGVWENIANTTNTYNENLTTVGTYEFRVLVQSGVCASEYSNIITITVYPITVDGTLTSSNTEVCVNSNSGVMTLAGYTGNIVRWERRINGGSWQNISNTTNTHNENLTTEGTYEFRVLVQSGVCASAYSNIIIITVDPATVPGTLTSSNSQVCVNSNSGVMTLAGYTGNILRWERRINGGAWENIANTTNTYNENLTTVGTYEFRVLVQNGVCASEYSNIITITVDPLTVPGTLTAANTQVCVNNNSGVMTLTGYTGNIVRWERRINGGTWQNIANTTDTYDEDLTTVGTYEFRVLVQSGVCSFGYSNILEINVDSSPLAGNLNGNNNHICINYSTGIMTLSDYNGTIIKWQTRYNGGIWTDINNVSNTYEETLTQSGLWEYRVIVGNGVCTPDTSNIFSINVSDHPIAGTLIGGGNYCGSANPILTLTGYDGNIVYWEEKINNNNWTIINNTLDTYSPNLTNSGKYTYRVKVSNSICPDVYSNEIVIQVYDSTIAGMLVYPYDSLCLGESTALITNIGYLGNIVKWQYSIDGGAWIDIPFTGDQYQDVPTISGIWQYRAVVQNGVCEVAYTDPATFYILSLPIASFDYVVNSYTVNFNNNSQNADIYLWSFGDGITSTDINPIHIYNQDGIYNVSLIATNGICSDTIEQTISITFITIYNSNLNITLYPNPSIDGDITLYFVNNSNKTQISIKVINQLGEIVKDFRNIKLDDNNLKLDLGSLGSGVYSVEIIFDKERAILPLIIVK